MWKMRSENRRRQTRLPCPEFRALGLQPLGRTYHHHCHHQHHHTWNSTPFLEWSTELSGCRPASRGTKTWDLGGRGGVRAHVPGTIQMDAPPESGRPKGNFPQQWWILVVTGLAAPLLARLAAMDVGAW